MTPVSTSQNPSVPFDGLRLVLNLFRDQNGSYAVKCCEVIGAGFNNRTTFGTRNHIEDVVDDRLAASILNELEDVGPDHRVISLPNFALELPGLLLAHAHVIVSAATSRGQAILVRFRHVVGSIGKALKLDIGLSETPVRDSERMVSEFLQDLALPLLELLRPISNQPSMAFNEAPAAFEHVAARAKEVEVHIELLRRYSNSLPEATPDQS